MFKKLDKLEQDLTEVRGGLFYLKENTDLDFKAINNSTFRSKQKFKIC